MKLTRRQVAGYLADGLSDVSRLRLAAAWLVANHRDDEARHLVHDVQSLLAGRGQVVAMVVTARPLSPALAAKIKNMVKLYAKAETVELNLQVDPEVVGGVRIELPDAELDATVRTRLARLVAESRP